MAEIACMRFAQNQTIQNSSMDQGGAYEVPPLSEKLLASIANGRVRVLQGCEH